MKFKLPKLGLFLIALGTYSRVVPHPANFTPIGAISIYATRKLGFKASLVITLTSMIIADIFLGFSRITTFVYLGIIGYVIFAKIINNRFAAIALPLIGSIWFFTITNLGVWLGPWYPHTFQGLTNCFVAAIPFYRNTIAGDYTFTIAIFGISYIIEKLIRKEGLWPQSLKKGILTKR